MKNNSKTISSILALLIGISIVFRLDLIVLAEQTGSSPESGSDSNITKAYDWLAAKGINYGGNDSADWTNDWGTMWNRIMESAAWEAAGSATPANVPSGMTFYASSNDRQLQTGTLYQNQAKVSREDWECSANNSENSGTCAANDQEYTGEESTWTLTTTGGTPRSVSDNGSTISLISNKVYQDGRTKLYWSDRSATAVDNEFSYVNGDDRVNPTGNSCNFLSPGTANQWCDNQDTENNLNEDDDVSATEFCLNLELDADNADGDNDGSTGMETDWYLPTAKERHQATVFGIANNVPNVDQRAWSSTEHASNRSSARFVTMNDGYSSDYVKDTDHHFRCVRRD